MKNLIRCVKSVKLLNVKLLKSFISYMYSNINNRGNSIPLYTLIFLILY